MINIPFNNLSKKKNIVSLLSACTWSILIATVPTAPM